MKSGEYSSDAAEIVLINPKAGSFFAQRRLRHRLDQLDRDALVICPRSREETEALAAQASRDQIPRLIVVGGDGTLHHAVNGFLSVPTASTKLAIIPAGTANDYVASLRRHVRGTGQASIKVDVGVVRCGDFKRYFMNVAGVGLTAHTAVFSRPAPWLPARLRYTLGLFRTLIHGWRHVPTKVQLDHGPEVLRNILTISIAIGQREGSYTLAPSAKIDDGRFGVLLASDLRRRDVLRYLPGLTIGRLPQGDPRIKNCVAAEVTLRPHATIHLHLDGEVYGDGQLPKTQEISFRQAASLEIGLLETRFDR